ncbi:MAG: hypothetical protein AAFX06_12520 [Planctomycetota bacterium]
MPVRHETRWAVKNTHFRFTFPARKVDTAITGAVLAPTDTFQIAAAAVVMSGSDQHFPALWRSERPRRSCQSDALSPRLEPATPRWKRELDRITGNEPPKTRTIPLKLLVPLLLEANRQSSTWLEDFADDLVTLDADLHDVLIAFDKLRKEAA